MSIGNRVRRIYERHPYPPPKMRQKSTWTLPAVEWMEAMRESPKPFDPRRILAAGCGVGTEAFGLADRFPSASVVAVDFSERSIAAAKKTLRQMPFRERLQFSVADLSDGNLHEITGDRFDLVTCHGVLSYIPDTAAVLRNFARVLSPDGVLHLGVNGASHPSVLYRATLPQFGIATGEFTDDETVRDVLRVFDSLTFPRFSMGESEAGFIAGDIFGPLNRALSLSDWASLIRSTRLHLLGSYHGFFVARDLINRGLHGTVMPRSRAELSQLVDRMQPMSFHQLLISRRKPAPIAWDDPSSVIELHPHLTRLYKITGPRSGGRTSALRKVVLKSVPVKTRVKLEVPQWEVGILRAADGKRSIREILGKARVSRSEVAEAMYMLYQLGVLNLLPS